jgi:hypothetical protein
MKTKTKIISEIDLLQCLNDKMDILIALSSINGITDDEKKVKILSNLRYSKEQISTFIGISIATVGRIRKKLK